MTDTTANVLCLAAFMAGVVAYGLLRRWHQRRTLVLLQRHAELEEQDRHEGWAI